jgi:hypothetical protein
VAGALPEPCADRWPLAERPYPSKVASPTLLLRGLLGGRPFRSDLLEHARVPKRRHDDRVTREFDAADDERPLSSRNHAVVLGSTVDKPALRADEEDTRRVQKAWEQHDIPAGPANVAATKTGQQVGDRVGTAG